MKIRTDRWHYKCYRFGSQLHRDKGAARRTNGCTYWRRAIFEVAFVAGILASNWIVKVFVTTVILAIIGVLNVLANLVTIPLGFGVAVVWPGEDFLRIQFQVGRRRRSLAQFLVPFWILVATATSLWFGFSYFPKETTEFLISTSEFIIGVGKIVGWIVLFIVCVLALFALREAKDKFLGKDAEGPVADAWQHVKAYCKAKKEGICPIIEFVDPPSSS
jgi:hypothetical protein